MLATEPRRRESWDLHGRICTFQFSPVTPSPLFPTAPIVPAGVRAVAVVVHRVAVAVDGVDPVAVVDVAVAVVVHALLPSHSACSATRWPRGPRGCSPARCRCRRRPRTSTRGEVPCVRRVQLRPIPLLAVPGIVRHLGQWLRVLSRRRIQDVRHPVRLRVEHPGRRGVRAHRRRNGDAGPQAKQLQAGYEVEPPDGLWPRSGRSAARPPPASCRRGNGRGPRRERTARPGMAREGPVLTRPNRTRVRRAAPS